MRSLKFIWVAVIFVNRCFYRFWVAEKNADINFDAPNYQDIADLFPTSNFGFKDITAVFCTINDVTIIHERLNLFLIDRPTAETSKIPTSCSIQPHGPHKTSSSNLSPRSQIHFLTASLLLSFYFFYCGRSYS